MDPNDEPQSTKMVTYWHDLEIEQIDKLACKQMHSEVNFMLFSVRFMMNLIQSNDNIVERCWENTVVNQKVNINTTKLANDSKN